MPTSSKKKKTPSQLMDLFIHVADLLGYSSDRDIADLAGVSVENVANWRSGSVQEFKPAKLKQIKQGIAAQIAALREQSGQAHGQSLSALEIEDGSSPTDLQRAFRNRVAYDYLGHRFLYYEPMGALAWESLIKRGYEQDRWLDGVGNCAEAWLDTTKDSYGRCKGPIAEALGWGRRNLRHGMDVISLGPGEGGKEGRFFDTLFTQFSRIEQKLSWLAYSPVDVSIPLLLTASRVAREKFEAVAAESARSVLQVKPFCGDFEEGPVAFESRLPSAVHHGQPSLRLIMMLGNTFGNLRDEESFLKKQLPKLLRPGDLVWFEVGLRMEPLEQDPLFRMTKSSSAPTAAETNRSILLEGPYRRWESATGRRPADIDVRVWVREDDDSCRVPGSVNFCHDLVIKDERRVCTMLYSRRYQLDSLCRWLEENSLAVERISKVADGKNRARVAHILLRRTGSA